MKPHRFLMTLAAAAYVIISAHAANTSTPPSSGERLYNGIQLPSVWPPQDRPVSREPMAPPYLSTPPAVIPIDVGRQLFVDDFLIAATDLTRTHHAAEYYPQNPVLVPDRDWETGPDSQGHPAPVAMVFSDGVWYDPQDQLYKMWYMGGYCASTCYATSRDGIHWEKPILDVVPETNIVSTLERDSTTIWLDQNDPDPARRFKMFAYHHQTSKCLAIYYSPDGIHWTDCQFKSGYVGDRSTAFYNPFRNVWVYNIRDYDHTTIGRFRRYSENRDMVKASEWAESKAPFWVGADTLDPQRADLKTPCELYNLDCVAYESLMIGFFSIWRGQPNDRAKPNEICVGFSRDGYYWSRPTHKPFIPVSEKQGDWNWGNVQSAGGGCLVVGDQLYFYVSGRKGVPGSPASGVCATGLATLRRDGFASMDSGATEGVLTTRPVTFSGKYLFVNLAAPGGLLRVEVLDDKGQVISPYAKDACVALTQDSTHAQVTWNGAEDLAPLSGRPVQFRFYLTQGSLYAFWVSPDSSGASHGYIAAGGPGFTGPSDTPGVSAQ